MNVKKPQDAWQLEASPRLTREAGSGIVSGLNPTMSILPRYSNSRQLSTGASFGPRLTEVSRYQKGKTLAYSTSRLLFFLSFLSGFRHWRPFFPRGERGDLWVSGSFVF